MPESKLATMQTMLQATYDFYDQISLSELTAGVAAQSEKDAQKDPFSAGEHFGSASYGRFVESGVIRYAAEAGVDSEDFAVAAAWLVARGLLAYTNEWMPSGFQLTTLGEDLIDLGISVEEWYQGPYRENLLNSIPAVANSEGEEQ